MHPLSRSWFWQKTRKSWGMRGCMRQRLNLNRYTCHNLSFDHMWIAHYSNAVVCNAPRVLFQELKTIIFSPSMNRYVITACFWFLAAWRKPCTSVIWEAGPWVRKGRTGDLGVQSKECPYVLSRGWGWAKQLFSCMINVPVILLDYNVVWIGCIKPRSHTYKHYTIDQGSSTGGPGQIYPCGWFYLVPQVFWAKKNDCVFLLLDVINWEQHNHNQWF